MSQSALHFIIRGRVQGVGYRAWLAAHARNRRLRGWVRNRRDGTLEAVLLGDMVELEMLHADCLHGPSAAQVEQIDVEPWTGAVPEDFEQRPTV